MSRNNVLADVLSIIKNGQRVRLAYVSTPSSHLVKSCLSVLQQEGYIDGYEECVERKGVHALKITLRYYKGEPVISVLRNVSKPGCRVYSKASRLPKSHNGLGVYVVSTSKGVMADHVARAAGDRHGGEILLEVF